MSAKLSPARKFLYSVIVFVAFFALLEVNLRLIGVESFAENQFFPLNRDVSFVGIYDKDSELFWRLKKDILAESRTFSSLSYRINRDGFRGPEIVEDNRQTILALGNSCTFGWGVVADSIFTARLQQRLADYRVLNRGVPGYSSHQGRILYERVTSRIAPEITLIMFGWNDHWPAGADISDQEHDPLPQWALDAQNSLSRLRTFQMLRRVTLDLSAPDESARPRFDLVAGKRRVGLSEFKDNLQAIIQRARSVGSEPVLLIPPIAALEVYLPDAGASAFHDLHARYQRAIAETAAATSTLLIDLQPAFDGRKDLFDYPLEDPAHFNAAGHAVVADEVLRLLRDETRLASPD
ncbi:MAG TPA: SGNH/GDSL hydrolase family protein [candidate division Zixibacteria bacterium]|nr:SGNH/GDSL hydrolase family protein [candidate division Zixibacteria bacterium]